ncbi:hypothetical protein AB0K60_12150 [Thermopolyspora sp. NPDC052614]|uniref:hypothetical protein n=1 Tax=Thermopolyspora sp. NPDC052614 TaxID=3155682 RepID=UPI003429FE50
MERQGSPAADGTAAPRGARVVKPPLWLRALMVPLAALVTWGLAETRGLGMAVLTGLVWGMLAVGTLAWDRKVAFSRAHPLASLSALPPLTFISVSYLAPWSLVTCALVAVAISFPVILASWFLHHRHRPG